MLSEVQAGWPIVVSRDLLAERQQLGDDEIRERISGNVPNLSAGRGIHEACSSLASSSVTSIGTV
jgi:hypothetical protein